MASLFDKNGNATETLNTTVSGFDPATSEFVGTYDVRILVGTGIPAFSTTVLAPDAKKGNAVCWSGSDWEQVIDLRGNTAYVKSTGAAVTIATLGPLIDELTVIAPATPFDKWNGVAWATDMDSLKAAAIADAELQRSALLAKVNTEIAWRQDAVDEGEATSEESIMLSSLRKYRVQLMRVNLCSPDWPLSPITY